MPKRTRRTAAPELVSSDRPSMTAFARSPLGRLLWDLAYTARIDAEVARAHHIKPETVRQLRITLNGYAVALRAPVAIILDGDMAEVRRTTPKRKRKR